MLTMNASPEARPDPETKSAALQCYCHWMRDDATKLRRTNMLLHLYHQHEYHLFRGAMGPPNGIMRASREI